MTESTPRRSFWKEILAGAMLTAFILGLALVAAPPTAMGGWFRGGGSDPERARKHAEFMTGYVLNEVDATPEQTERVTAIVLAFVQDMQGLKEEHRARHAELLAALSQPEISRASLETLRSEELATLDGVSQRLVDAVVDAAAVLTVEQRTKLVELAEDMHERHRH